MDTKDEIEKLLPEYFQNHLSQEEMLLVEQWKSASEENEKTFEEAACIWDAVNQLHQMRQFDKNKALQTVHNRIGQSDNKHRSPQWYKLAAAVLIPLVIAGTYLFFNKTETAGTDSPTITLKSQPGLITSYSLPDNSKVWLNYGSEISYSADFNNTERRVEVKGEAFFDVVKDKNRPFIVSAHNLNIRVLGTTFNVVSRPEDRTAEVVLATGKVQLLAKGSKSNESLGSLSPGEKAVFNRENKSVSIETVEVGQYTSWKEGKLVFRDDPLVDIIHKLNQKFNVEIKIADEQLEAYVYTATFEDESLYQILDLLKISAPLEYEILQQGRDNPDSNEKQIILLKYRDNKNK